MMKKNLSFKLVLVLIFLLGPLSGLAQSFLPIPDSSSSTDWFRLYGSGYVSPALSSEDGYTPGIKLTLSLKVSNHLLVLANYTRSPGFNRALASSIHTRTIVFPERNTDAYLLHLAIPFVTTDKEVAKRVTKVTISPFFETYYLMPKSPAFHSYSLTSNDLSYEGTSFQIGAKASWVYYPLANRYSLSGSLFYYRTTIFDDSVESFRNMFGDPYLPTAFRGFGAGAVARMNDFSFSLEIKQNINLIRSSTATARVNDKTGVRKQSEIEGMHWDLQIGWSGELLSF